jgi:hypothetical protein
VCFIFTSSYPSLLVEIVVEMTTITITISNKNLQTIDSLEISKASDPRLLSMPIEDREFFESAVLFKVTKSPIITEHSSKSHTLTRDALDIEIHQFLQPYLKTIEGESGDETFSLSKFNRGGSYSEPVRNTFWPEPSANSSYERVEEKKPKQVFFNPNIAKINEVTDTDEQIVSTMDPDFEQPLKKPPPKKMVTSLPPELKVSSDDSDSSSHKQREPMMIDLVQNNQLEDIKTPPWKSEDRLPRMHEVSSLLDDAIQTMYENTESFTPVSTTVSTSSPTPTTSAISGTQAAQETSITSSNTVQSTKPTRNSGATKKKR